MQLYPSLNGMVYTTCVSAIRKTALDPTVGYVHAPGERRFTLSLDIADIFKPILADRVLFRLCKPATTLTW